MIYAARALRDFGDGFVAVLLPVYLTASASALRGRRCRNRRPARLGADNARHRAAGRQDRSAPPARGGVRADGPDRARLRAVERLLGRPPGRGDRHHQSLRGQRQHLRAARACAAVALGRRCRAHADVRALQPDRRARRSDRRARLGQPRLLGRLGVSHLAALKGMFLAYAMLGIAGGACYAFPLTGRLSEEKPGSVLGPSRGSSTGWRRCSASMPSPAGSPFSRSSPCGCSTSSACRCPLRPFFFWSGLLAAFSFPVAAWLARRIGLVNTHGVHAHPSSVPDPGRRRPGSTSRCAAPRARGAVADGRADPLLLRHGRRHAAGASGGREHHSL